MLADYIMKYRCTWLKISPSFVDLYKQTLVASQPRYGEGGEVIVHKASCSPRCHFHLLSPNCDVAQTCRYFATSIHNCSRVFCIHNVPSKINIQNTDYFISRTTFGCCFAMLGTKWSQKRGNRYAKLNFVSYFKKVSNVSQNFLF
jgi:hypothetical protein